MGVLDGFDDTWSKARATFGEGTPQDGSRFDNSAQLREMQSKVESAKPGPAWSGSAADSYATANERQGRVLGETAALDQRLRTEVDRAANVVTTGRRDLDSVKQWVHNAASTVQNPNSAQGQRTLMPIVSKGAGEIADIVGRSNTDMNSIAGRVRVIDGEYKMLGGDPKLGTGDPTDGEPSQAVGDKQEPWRYPWDPPPPSDSAPGGGRWEMGQGYPPGPNGGPPMGPFSTPAPWQRQFNPPIAAGPSGFQDVVKPPPNGWGVNPSLVLQEGYKIRATGETFNGAADHVQWIQRDGVWYQAQWVDYNLEAEHLYQVKGNMTFPWGMDDWQPIDIKDVYRIQVDNPRLTVYLPNPYGPQIVLDPKRPGVSAG